MKLRQLLTDRRAVSPVIGVILMVAITVILAAVIGTFVLGLGSGVQQSSPSVSMSFDFNLSANEAVVTHEGGNTLTSDNSQKIIVDDSGGTTQVWANQTNGQFPIESGDSYTFTDFQSGETVRVVWFEKTPEPGASSATIAEQKGPT
ncbi:MAG: type IV pilin [Haloplanus sp.]